VFWQPNQNEIRLIHGQVIFTNQAAALNALATYFPIIPSNVSAGSIDLGGIIVKRNATDLTVTGDASFFRRSQITGGGGGSVAQDMQETYILSLQPQILTNLVQGAVEFKDGTATDTNPIFQILDQSDNIAFEVTGVGVTTALALDVAKTGVVQMDAPMAIATPTTLEVPAGTGQIVNGYDDYGNIIPLQITWAAVPLFAVPNLGVDNATWIFINNLGVVSSQNASPTETQLSQNIFLGSTIKK